jgi:MoaA/NifB/PqqE/SkfB family radical SAM enzyme
MQLLDKCVSEIISWKRGLFFSPFKVNEPLLDARTIPLCERINREAPWIRLRLFTNGSPLTQEKISQIAKLKNVEHLWVSLNSHIPEEYEQLMGLKFELTAKRLDVLHEQDFPHPVVLSAVGFPNEPFRRYCFDRWPKFKALAIKKDSWLGYTDPQITEVPDKPCVRWFELSITSTGVVSLCCMDGPAEYSIGDVSKQTLLEVYNSPHWRERREALLSRRQVSPCDRCTY